MEIPNSKQAESSADIFAELIIMGILNLTSKSTYFTDEGSLIQKEEFFVNGVRLDPSNGAYIKRSITKKSKE